MRQTLTIPGRLNGLNEYTSACRSNPYKGSRMKKNDQRVVMDCILLERLKPHDGAVRIHYRFFEKPNRGKLRDKSNIAAFAIKVIEDALQEMRIIKDDGWDYMAGYRCDFMKVKENPRIEVEIEDV